MTGRPLLLAASVASLNAALLASASAETCVTGVNPTFANAVNEVSGQPGASSFDRTVQKKQPAVPMLWH